MNRSIPRSSKSLRLTNRRGRGVLLEGSEEQEKLDKELEEREETEVEEEL